MTRSLIAFSSMAAVCLFGVFAAGAPLQAAHGCICLATGAVMLLVPPRVAVPRVWWLLAGLFLVLCALAFLPKGVFPAPAWRSSLEALGVSTGSMVTAHPGQTGAYLAGVAITAMVGLFLLGHRASEPVQQWLALAFTVGVGLYAAVCIGIEQAHWKLAWDPQVSFGLFPNRNHSATILVMGALTGIASLAQSIRRRQGGSGGLAALAIVLSTGAVLGFCGSRAGVVLLGLGVVVWLAGLDRSTISLKMMVVISVLAVAAGAVFWFSTSAVKTRLAETIETIVEPTPPESAGEAPLAGPPPAPEKDRPLDFRLLIYKDTLGMLAHEPLTGVGLGMFRYVFPLYRDASATSEIALHPESDWLMMAAEAGVGSALVLAGLVAAVAVAAVRQARRRRGWTLRWGSLVAALIVPIHGLFDVPGHRVGLAWSALLLVALTFRVPDTAVRPGLPARLFFRLGGAGILLAGVFLVRAEWWGGPQSVLVEPDRLAAQARALYAADHARLKELSAAGAPAVPDDASDRTLKSAIALADQALALTPLEPDLQYLKGALALNFDDMDAAVDQAFAAQQLLDPIRPRVPLLQAQAWAPIDPVRTSALWSEALDRAAALHARAPSAATARAHIWSLVMAQAKGHDELARRALALADGDQTRILDWARQVAPALLDESMPSLLAAEVTPNARLDLFRVWRSRGSRPKVQAFVDTKPEFQNLP